MADDNVVIITLYHPGFGDISAGQYELLGMRKQALGYGNTLAEQKRGEMGATTALRQCENLGTVQPISYERTCTDEPAQHYCGLQKQTAPTPS